MNSPTKMSFELLSTDRLPIFVEFDFDLTLTNAGKIIIIPDELDWWGRGAGVIRHLSEHGFSARKIETKNERFHVVFLIKSIPS